MAYGDKFKEEWNRVDEVCPHCRQVTKINRGLSKQNLKRLVFSKPTIQDWMMLAIILLVLMMAWRYGVETKQCYETLNNIDNVCLDLWESNQKVEQMNQELKDSYKDINITLLNNLLT